MNIFNLVELSQTFKKLASKSQMLCSHIGIWVVLNILNVLTLYYWIEEMLLSQWMNNNPAVHKKKDMRVEGREDTKEETRQIKRKEKC